MRLALIALFLAACNCPLDLPPDCGERAVVREPGAEPICKGGKTETIDTCLGDAGVAFCK